MSKLRYERFVVQGLEPGAFNGAIHPLKDGTYLFACRRAHGSLLTGRLNARYAVIGKCVPLNLIDNEDPRFFEWNGRLFMQTCYAGPVRQELWPINPDGGRLVESDFHFFFDRVDGIEGYKRRWEKNWAPFVYDETPNEPSRNDRLFFEYSISPRIVLSFHPERNAVRAEFNEKWVVPANYRGSKLSELRLSVPSVVVGTPEMPCVRLGIFHFRHEGSGEYWSGFYTFNPDPPWNITAMSREPFFGPGDAPGPAYLRLIFPQSMQVDGDKVTIAGGMNDRACVVFHCSLKDILSTLEPLE